MCTISGDSRRGVELPLEICFLVLRERVCYEVVASSCESGTDTKHCSTSVSSLSFAVVWIASTTSFKVALNHSVPIGDRLSSRPATSLAVSITRFVSFVTCSLVCVGSGGYYASSC
jgi:hypothetical protein